MGWRQPCATLYATVAQGVAQALYHAYAILKCTKINKVLLRSFKATN